MRSRSLRSSVHRSVRRERWWSSCNAWWLHDTPRGVDRGTISASRFAEDSERGSHSMADSSAHAEWPQLPDVAADWESRDVRSRVVIKADLLPAVSVLSLVALLGVPLGWVWSRLAPATRMRVLPGGDRAPLPMESWHEFTALAVFMLLGLAAGIVVAVAVWFLRARRGPVML